MRIHHLSCGTLCPFPARLVDGEGGFFARALMICHVLLVETADGLLLVDTGFGVADVATPARTLGRAFTLLSAARLDPAATALRQVERLGYRAEDVRHLVPTHLDLDHAGGFPDFPRAKVHVRELEHAAAMKAPGLRERMRYKAAHTAHGPLWQLYPEKAGERWAGFEGVQEVAGTKGEVLLVPLSGHTRGHTGVAVKGEQGWLLHAGDAYFSRHEMHPERPWCPLGLKLFQWHLEVDRAARLANQARLREAARTGAARVFCAHDPRELEAFSRAP